MGSIRWPTSSRASKSAAADVPIDPRKKAFKAWPVLVQAAAGRKTMTYKQLAAVIGGAPINMRLPLDVIAKHCIRNGWPHLTAVVVNTDTQRPGDGFLAEGGDLTTILDAVFAKDWRPIANPFRVFVDG